MSKFCAKIHESAYIYGETELRDQRSHLSRIFRFRSILLLVISLKLKSNRQSKVVTLTSITHLCRGNSESDDQMFDLQPNDQEL